MQSVPHRSEWIRLATAKTVVRRSLKYAAIVGFVLVAIDYGHVIVRGELVRIGFTVVVPYLVSTFASVSTAHEHERRHALERARFLDPSDPTTD